MRKRLAVVIVGWALSQFISAACGRSAHIQDYANPEDNITVVLQQLINQYETVIIDEGLWYVSPGIQLRSGVTIKGMGVDKSVLMRDHRVPLQSGMLFYTEYANPDSYTNKNASDAFSSKRIAYRRIRFKDLTIDFNRNPERYTNTELKGKNLYGIALIRATKCSIENCAFRDGMTNDCNNGYPAVVVYQSSKVQINNNHCEGMTFLQVVYSYESFIRGNSCRNSVSTAIATTSGSHHLCENNSIDGVYWEVSCLGINSTHCTIRGNKVIAAKHNLSCLTLGHEHSFFSASGAVVDNNVFESNGCRCILIQNGNGISIMQNTCSCVINENDSILSSGCVAVSGQSRDLYGIIIKNNRLQARGNGSAGCITYRGSGEVLIEGNDIEAVRGVSILMSNEGTAKFFQNKINSTHYSIQANCRDMLVSDNELSDGIITTATGIVIKNNKITNSNHCSFLGTKWERVEIENNEVSSLPSKNVTSPCVFLFDASEKDASYKTDQVKILNNSTSGVFNGVMVRFSGTKNCPQLDVIAN